MPLDAAGFAQHAASILPLEGRGLTVRRNGRTLVDGVDVHLGADGVSALMGPNGAGKSLLLRLLAGLIRPDAGTVLWGGSPPDRPRALRLGFVFQRPVLLRRSAMENVRYALSAAGIPRAQRADRAAAVLVRAGLTHLSRAPARVLSGGEQQRLAIARALATGPEVLLLDEPTSNLDPASTLTIETMVRDARTAGAKVVLVTHDVGQARRLADEVIFLHHGRIVERTSAEPFFDLPESAAARAFIAGGIVL